MTAVRRRSTTWRMQRTLSGERESEETMRQQRGDAEATGECVMALSLVCGESAGSVRGSSAALEEEKESPAPAAAATAQSCRCPDSGQQRQQGGGDGRAAQLRTESSRARDSGSSRPCPLPCSALSVLLLWLPEAECGGRHARIGTRGVLACSLLSPQSTPYRRCCAPPPALPLAASQPTDSDLRECRRSFLGCRRPRRYHFP